MSDIAQVKDIVPRIQYTASAGQTVFVYPFPVFDEGDIVVEQNGTVLTLSADYTVSGVAAEDGGNITLTSGATVGDIITIYRDMALERLIDYQQNGDFLAANVNRDFDRLWLAIQQLQGGADAGEGIGRSWRATPDDTLTDSELVIAALSTRSGRFVGFDSNGKFTYSSPAISSDPSQIYSDVLTMQNDASLTVGQFVRTVGYTTPGDGGGNNYEIVAAGTGTDDGGSFIDLPGSGLQARGLFPLGEINTKQFSAITDESTDNTAVTQAALNFAKGIPVIVPPGAFFDLSALVFPDNVGASGYYILDYRANDDISSPGHPASGTTNERIRFTQNNNPSGYNNETIFNSGFSTGVVLDVRRDVDVPNLGAGQDVLFGRTSVVWQQDGLNKVQFKYTDSAGDTSTPGLDDGWTCQFFEQRQTLTGVDQSSFAATLAVNDMVKGATSGARGWVKAINVGSILITHLSGTFVVGETIILEPAVETTTDTLSAVSSIAGTSRSNRLGMSMKQVGNLFSNIQGDDAVYPFNVGGIIGVQQSGTSNGAFTNAELMLADLLSNPSQTLRIFLEAATGDGVLSVNGQEVLRLSVVDASDRLATLTGTQHATLGLAPGTCTTAQLNDITNGRNTTNKTAGLMLFNVSSTQPVWAAGGTAGDVWVDATGATVATPV